MKTHINPAVRAVAFLAACGLLFNLAGCQSEKPGAEDEPAGITQFIANGSFEELDGRNPKGWEPRPGRQAEATLSVDPSAHGGSRSILISSDKGAEASWLAVVPMAPYSRYRLSGWIKTESLVPGSGQGVQIGIHGEEAWRTPPVTGTQDWTRVEVK